MKPKALVLQARGTNRDLEVSDALSFAGADPVGVPLNDLRVRKANWADYQMLVIPGGFSYADALGAGKLLAIDLNSYFEDEIAAFVASGKPVIGICNGFQALVKSGILPGSSIDSKVEANKRTVASESVAILPSTARDSTNQVNNNAQATLTFNARGHFECRWVELMPISQTCIWTRDLDEIISCPIAHGEGNFQVADKSLLIMLLSLDQIALTYVYPDGSPSNGEYPANPNGSMLDIAGICNPTGNVLGLMPHPENHIHTYQHPQWTRGMDGRRGLLLFKNGVRYASQL